MVKPHRNISRRPAATESTDLFIKILAESIRVSRAEQGMTIGALCAQAGITKQTYQRIIKGDQGVSIGIVLAVMEALGILDQHISNSFPQVVKR